MAAKRKAAMPVQQEEEEKTMDPNYKRFLDFHLRPDSKSYIFKLNEKLTAPSDACCSDAEEKKKKKKKKAAMPLQQEEKEAMHPNYKRFLDFHLRPDSKSYILKLNEKLTAPSHACCSDAEEKKKKKKKKKAKSQIPGSQQHSRSEPSIRSKCCRINLEKNIALKRDDASCSRKRDLQHCQGDGDSSFEDRLRRCLDEPFSREEYGQLMEEATLRRPKSGSKELRTRRASFLTTGLGLSYLDRHSDLREQIESADVHKRLTLLRGFFFWLKNLGHEGAFIPWKKPAFRNGKRSFVIHDLES